MKTIVASLVIILVAGCGANKGAVLETSPDDPARVTKRIVITSLGQEERVASRNVVTTVRYTLKDRSELKSHSATVCLLAGLLPSEIRHQEIGKITATKRTYGSVDEVLLAMADEGRRIGVEAIDGLQANQQIKGPLPWRVTSPVGTGRLLKIDPSALPLDCGKMGGTAIAIEMHVPPAASAPAVGR